MERKYIGFSGGEAALVGRILDQQAVGEGYRCAGPTETARLRRLRLLGLIERLPRRKRTEPTLWAVTTWGLGHPALQAGGAVYGCMGEAAKVRFGGGRADDDGGDEGVLDRDMGLGIRD